MSRANFTLHVILEFAFGAQSFCFVFCIGPEAKSDSILLNHVVYFTPNLEDPFPRSLANYIRRTLTFSRISQSNQKFKLPTLPPPFLWIFPYIRIHSSTELTNPINIFLLLLLINTHIQLPRLFVLHHFRNVLGKFFGFAGITIDAKFLWLNDFGSDGQPDRWGKLLPSSPYISITIIIKYLCFPNLKKSNVFVIFS